MEQSSKVSVAPIDDDRLRALVDLAEVPNTTAKRDFFCLNLRLSVEAACRSHLEAAEAIAVAKQHGLIRAAQAARKLIEALSVLDEHESLRLETCYRQTVEAGWIAETGRSKLSSCRVLVYKVADIVTFAAGHLPVPSPDDGPQDSRRGRRRGTKQNPQFDWFVEDILVGTMLAGGKLTFEKEGKKGTLLRAIEILRPCLPDNVVPKVIAASTLQRIKKRATSRVQQILAGYRTNN